MPAGSPRKGGFHHSDEDFPPLSTSKNPTVVKTSSIKPTYSESTRTKPFVPVSKLPLLADVAIKSPIVMEKEGVKAVIFQQEEVEASMQAFCYALVARFHGVRPSVNTFERHINTEWGLNTPAVVGLLNSRHIMIRLDSERDFTHAWVREENNFNNHRFTLFKWSEGLLDNKVMTRAVWIELQRLPVMYQVPSILQQIANNIGRFLRLDERTRAGKHPIAPRLCVELDFAVPLPSEVWIGYITPEGKDIGFTQKITYGFNRSKCNSCNSLGHESLHCPLHNAKSAAILKRRPFKAEIESQGTHAAQKHIWMAKTQQRRGSTFSNKDSLDRGKNFVQESLDIAAKTPPNDHALSPSAFLKYTLDKGLDIPPPVFVEPSHLYNIPPTITCLNKVENNQTEPPHLHGQSLHVLNDIGDHQAPKDSHPIPCNLDYIDQCKHSAPTPHISHELWVDIGTTTLFPSETNQDSFVMGDKETWNITLPHDPPPNLNVHLAPPLDILAPNSGTIIPSSAQLNISTPNCFELTQVENNQFEFRSSAFEQYKLAPNPNKRKESKMPLSISTSNRFDALADFHEHTENKANEIFTRDNYGQNSEQDSTLNQNELLSDQDITRAIVPYFYESSKVFNVLPIQQEAILIKMLQDDSQEQQDSQEVISRLVFKDKHPIPSLLDSIRKAAKSHIRVSSKAIRTERNR